MIDVPVYNAEGKQVDTVQMDAARFGGQVRPALLKQAVVMYQANLRQGTAATRSRSETVGSTRKLYRQKGTGNARMGAVRTPIRRGGGCTFAKKARDFSHRMPKRMRRLARNNAILAKAQSNEVVIIDGLTYDEPKTSRFAALLTAVGADRGCLLALHQLDVNVWKSGRNIPKIDIRQVDQLNAYEILLRRKLMFTREAFDRVAGSDVAGSDVAGSDVADGDVADRGVADSGVADSGAAGAEAEVSA